MKRAIRTMRRVGLLAGLAVSAAAEDAEMDVGVLKAADGAKLTYDYCTTCHSEMIIAQQGQTREGWDKLLVWMVQAQGMQPIDEPHRSEIIDYLATHHNTDRPNFPR